MARSFLSNVPGTTCADYIYMPGTGANAPTNVLDLTTSFSMACWVKFADLTDVTQTLFGKGYDGNGTAYSLGLAGGPVDCVCSTFVGSTGQSSGWAFSAAALNTTDWFHVYGEWNSVTPRWKALLNGAVASGDGFFGAGAQGVGPFHTTALFSIGSIFTTTTTPPTPALPPAAAQCGKFAGICEVAMWGGPLSTADLNALTNNGTGGASGPGTCARANSATSQSLLGYWPLLFSENGTTVPDHSSHGNDGTVGGTAVIADPTFLAAPSGGAISPILLATLKRRFVRR
jgi:hypothetical protein